MKTLYIDFEQGYKSLGSKDEIQKNFGLPMLQFDSWKEFKSLLGQLLDRRKIKKEVLIDGIKVPQEVIEWQFKEGINIDCIVNNLPYFNTASATSSTPSSHSGKETLQPNSIA